MSQSLFTAVSFQTADHSPNGVKGQEKVDAEQNQAE